MVASTASLNINVKTNNVDVASKKLTKLTRNGKKVEGQVIRLQDRFKSFGRNAASAVSAVDGPLGGVSSRISALTSVATTGGVAVTGLALAITGLAFVTQRGVRQLDEYNIELAKTEAILKATGFSAGVTAKELQDEAQAIAFNTLASVQGIQQAQAVLLTFDRIQGDVRANAVGLTQDLATVFGGTAASQATQLGKALQDPLKGITALNRVGVSFNQTQKDQIKLFQESGDIVAAQTIIIEALKNQVGGAGAAVAGGTLAGALDTAGQSFANFTAKLAKSTGAYDATLSFFDGLNERLASLSESLDGPSLEGITATIQAQYEKIDKLEAARDATSNKRLQARKQRAIDAANQELDALLNQQAEIARAVAVEDEKKIVALEGQKAKELEIKQEADKAELERLGKARVERLKEEYLLSEELKLARDERKADAAQQARDEAEAVKEAYGELSSGVQNSLSALTDTVGEFSGESSKAYRAAFAISKAFAVQQASMNFALALTQAIAAPDALTLSAKLTNYAAVAATAAPLLRTIGDAKFNGGRLQGGAVGSSDAVMVGERGPELFVPGQSGNIVNNNKMRNGGAGGETNITIVNQTTGRIDQVEKRQITENDVVLIIKEVVPREIANPNSKTSKQLKTSTSAARRLV